MHTMELTDGERQAILTIRAVDTKTKREAQARIEILRVAYEYENWLQENRAGSTYSTFCSEFEYSAPDDIARNTLFGIISEIRTTARDQAASCIIPAA